jgi:hypothetical protein
VRATSAPTMIVYVVGVLSVTCGRLCNPFDPPCPGEDDAILKNDGNGLAELDEDILTFDVPDDALERAAPVAGRRIMTLYRTKDPLSCGWPV